MLHQITNLKAPWPEGAVLGDVVKFSEVPAWALGKCKPADPDAMETAFFKPDANAKVPLEELKKAIAAEHQVGQEAAARVNEAHSAEINALRERLADTERQLADAQNQVADLTQQRDAERAKQAEAEKAQAEAAARKEADEKPAADKAAKGKAGKA